MGQAKPRQYSAPVQKGYCQVSHKLSQESLRLRSGIVKSFPARQDLFRLSKTALSRVCIRVLAFGYDVFRHSILTDLGNP